MSVIPAASHTRYPPAEDSIHRADSASITGRTAARSTTPVSHTRPKGRSISITLVGVAGRGFRAALALSAANPKRTVGSKDCIDGCVLE